MTFVDFCFMLAVFSVIGLLMAALTWVLERFDWQEEPFDDRRDLYDWAEEDEL